MIRHRYAAWYGSPHSPATLSCKYKVGTGRDAGVDKGVGAGEIVHIADNPQIVNVLQWRSGGGIDDSDFQRLDCLHGIGDAGAKPK